MAVFYVTTLVTYLLALLTRKIRSRNEKVALFFLFFVIATLVLVSAIRSGIGDTGMYRHLYELVNESYVSDGYEFGFVYFIRFLKLFSEDSQLLIIVTSVIINILNVVTIYRYSKDSYFELGIFLYITSGYYIVTMNGIRQSLAASILFFATTLIIKKKYKTYFFIVLLMSTIHSSALVMIPLYFIVRRAPWEKVTNMLFGLTLLGLIFYEPMMNIVMKLLGNTRYEQYAEFNEGGANLIRITVFAIPVIFAYLKQNIIKEKWEHGNIFVNMSIICFIVMLFSSYNWIFARFTIYFQLYSFVLMPYIISNCLEYKERRFFYFMLLVLYFIFFYYDQDIMTSVRYSTPYKFNDLLYYELKS